MTPKTPQCEVFWSLLSTSKHSGVPEDSKSPTLGVGVSSSHFTQSGVATGQAHQGEGKRKGGSHSSKNRTTRSTCQLGRLEAFPFEGNVCS